MPMTIGETLGVGRRLFSRAGIRQARGFLGGMGQGFMGTELSMRSMSMRTTRMAGSAWRNPIARNTMIGAGAAMGGRMIYNASTGQGMGRGVMGAGVMGGLGGAGFGMFRMGAMAQATRFNNIGRMGGSVYSARRGVSMGGMYRGNLML